MQAISSMKSSSILLGALREEDNGVATLTRQELNKLRQDLVAANAKITVLSDEVEEKQADVHRLQNDRCGEGQIAAHTHTQN
jgi:hypothetical protein